MAIWSTLGVYSMLPLLLTESHGMRFGHANSLLSMSRICAVLMPMAGGWLGDRFGHGRLMFTTLAFTGMLTIPIGLVDGYLFIVMVVLQPLTAVCFFPSLFATLAGLNLSENKDVAITLCIPIAFLFGGGILPTCIGIIGDNYSLDAGFVFVGSCMLSTVLIVFPFMLGKK